jgi:phosphoglycolate phosphatase
MVMPKFILFDVDGTLIDSGRSGFRALNLALQDLTGIENGFAGIRFAGQTDLLIVREALHRHEIGLDDGWTERFLYRYLEHLRIAVAEGRGHVKPGVRVLLENLAARSDVFLGLLTGNIEEGARAKLHPFSLNHFFPVGAYGCDAEERNGLLPVAVMRLAQHVNVSVGYEDCVVVGDTPSDVACASVHGARSIAVATGPYSVEVLQQTAAGLVLNDLSDTRRILNWLNTD